MNIIFGSNGFVGKNLELEGHNFYPTIAECNLLDYNSVFHYLAQFSGMKINIVNLAAKVAGVTYNQNHNTEMYYDNTLMVLNLAKAIKQLKFDNIYYLYVSSVCCYDNKFEMDEEMFFNGLPSKNNFGYGIAKKNGVFLLLSLKYDLPNFKFGYLIPTNMYGEYDQTEEKYSHVIPALYRKMLKDINKIEVLGNPNNIRNFLYVKDLCETISFFIDNRIENFANVCSNSHVSIQDLVKIVGDSINYKGNIVFGEGELDSRIIKNQKLLDIYEKHSKIKEFTTLNEGIKKSSKYYIEEIKYE